MAFFSILQVILNTFYRKLLQINRNNRAAIQNLYYTWLVVQVKILEIITLPKIFRSFLHFQLLLQYKNKLNSYITSYKSQDHYNSYFDCIYSLLLYIGTGKKGSSNKKKRINVSKIVPEIILCYFFEDKTPENSDKAKKSPTQSPVKDPVENTQLNEKRAETEQSIENSNIQDANVESSDKTGIELIETAVGPQKRKASDKQDSIVKRQKSSEMETHITVPESKMSEAKVPETEHTPQDIDEQYSKPGVMEQISVENATEENVRIHKSPSVDGYTNDSKVDNHTQDNSKVETGGAGENAYNDSNGNCSLTDNLNIKFRNNFGDYERVANERVKITASTKNEAVQSKDASTKTCTNLTSTPRNLASNVPGFEGRSSVSQPVPDTSASTFLKKLASAHKQTSPVTAEDAKHSIPDILRSIDTRKSILSEIRSSSSAQEISKKTEGIRASNLSDTQTSSLKSDSANAKHLADTPKLSSSVDNIHVSVDKGEIATSDENDDARKTNKEKMFMNPLEDLQLMDEDRCSSNDDVSLCKNASYGGNSRERFIYEPDTDEIQAKTEKLKPANTEKLKPAKTENFLDLMGGTLTGLTENETSDVLKNVIEKLKSYAHAIQKGDDSDMHESDIKQHMFRKLANLKSASNANVPSDDLKLSDIYPKAPENFDDPFKRGVDKGAFTENTGMTSYKDEKSENGIRNSVIQYANSKTRDSGDARESPVNAETRRFGERIRSPSPVQSGDNYEYIPNYLLYEIGESSREILVWDRNYTPYPGWAPDRYNVKKDARYQKKFYRQKREGTLLKSDIKSLNQQECDVSSTVSEVDPHLDQNKIESSESARSIFRRFVDKTIEDSDEIYLQKQRSAKDFEVGDGFCTADIPPLELCVPENFLAESASTANSDYSNRSIMNESPTSNSAERGDRDKTLELSPGEMEFGTEENIKLDQRLVEIGYLAEISFICGDVDPDEKYIYVRDRFYDPVNNIGCNEAPIPLTPIFRVSTERYKDIEYDLSVEEFLSNLRKFESIYYEMKFFDDPGMFRYRTLLRCCKIPLRLEYEFDDDYELFGDALKVRRFCKKVSLQIDDNNSGSVQPFIAKESPTAANPAPVEILQELHKSKSPTQEPSSTNNLDKTFEMQCMKDHRLWEMSKTDYVHKKFKYKRPYTEEDKCVGTSNESSLLFQLLRYKKLEQESSDEIGQIKRRKLKCEDEKEETQILSLENFYEIFENIGIENLQCHEMMSASEDEVFKLKTSEVGKTKFIHSINLCKESSIKPIPSTADDNKNIFDSNKSIDKENQVVCGEICEVISSEAEIAPESEKIVQGCEKAIFETSSAEHKVKDNFEKSKKNIVEVSSVVQEGVVNQPEMTKENEILDRQSPLLDITETDVNETNSDTSKACPLTKAINPILKNPSDKTDGCSEARHMENEQTKALTKSVTSSCDSEGFSTGVEYLSSNSKVSSESELENAD